MTMIDSTINHQIYQMKEQNIEYDEDITKILHLGSIVPDDLSLVLSLAFDNAREACEKVKDQRKISLKLQSSKLILFFISQILFLEVVTLIFIRQVKRIVLLMDMVLKVSKRLQRNIMVM